MCPGAGGETSRPGVFPAAGLEAGPRHRPETAPARPHQLEPRARSGVYFEDSSADPDAREVIALLRYRYLLFLIVGLLFAASSLQGKGSQTDILIQSTNDVFAELAPCG